MSLDTNNYKKILQFINTTNSSSICDFFERVQNSLASIFNLNKSMSWLSDSKRNMYRIKFINHSEDLISDYMGKYIALDIMAPKNIPDEFLHETSSSGSVLKISDYLQLGSDSKSLPYMDFIKKHNIIDQMVVYFINNSRVYGGIGFARFLGEEPFNKTERNNLILLSDYMSNSIKKLLKLEELKTANLFQNSLTKANKGIIKVDASLDIVFLSPSTETIVHKSYPAFSVDEFYSIYIKKQLKKYLSIAKTQAIFSCFVSADNYTYSVSLSKMSDELDSGVLIYFKEIQCKENSLQSLFSKRELDVYNLLVLGYSNKEISSFLFISINTVKKHLQKMYERLDVTNRTSLINKVNYLLK